MTILAKKMVEKPWGRETLPAPFSALGGKRIGEVWFQPPSEMSSVLIKYIFTSEKLSVQVHPSDVQAAELGESDRGKEECWLVIAAEPGATLGIGFKQHLDAKDMRRAALDGTIEDLMVWHPVAVGDFFYIPAGTVHAIGAGVSLIEIQQNSDVTYRLYDYGRPRESHLDKGIAVAEGAPHESALRRHLPEQGTVQLVDGPFFVSHRLDGIPGPDLLGEYASSCLILPRHGSVLLDNEQLHPGDCGIASALGSVAFDPSGSAILVKAR